MRELLLKNRVSPDKKISELFMAEHLDEGSLIQDFEKRMVYNVVDILEFTDAFDLELFLEQKRKEGHSPQTYIIKSRNSRMSKNKFFYKVVGKQYVVLNDKVFVLKVSQYLKKTVTLKKALAHKP